MRQIRFAAVALGLALVLAACQARTDQTSPSASTEPSNAASPGPDAVDEVLDAALATQADGTLRFAVDVRSNDPEDTNPPVTATGQVSFGDPAQFRFASPGVPGTVPPSEALFNGTTLFSRGRDTPKLPADTWVMLEIREGTLGHEAVMRQYRDSLLMLVTPLGVVSAERAEDDTIGTREVTRFVSQVDVRAARQHLPDTILPAYESRMTAFRAAGVPLTHEVEIWVDADGRIARTRYVQELQGQDIEALVVTYDFDGYGDPMDANPPAGDQVLTLDEATERYPATLESPGTP